MVQVTGPGNHFLFLSFYSFFSVLFFIPYECISYLGWVGGLAISTLIFFALLIWLSFFSFFLELLRADPESSTLLQQLCGCFFSHFLFHSDSVPVYTDGSKIEDELLWVAVFPHTTLRGCSPLFALIYSAELFTIYLALQCILDLPESSFTIFSDSRSAFVAPEALFSPPPWVQLLGVRGSALVLFLFYVMYLGCARGLACPSSL